MGDNKLMISSNSGILTISVDTTKVENMLNGYQRTLPEGMDKAAKKIAGMYADYYLAAIYNAKITPWTGESEINLIEQSKNPVKLGKGSYGVVVNQHLIELDSMRPHWVSLKRGRSITRWAKSKGIVPQNRTGFMPMIQSSNYAFPLFVRPHPWIKHANISAGKNVRTIAVNEINKVIRRKGD